MVLSIFRRSLRTGIVTDAYPAGGDATSTGYLGQIVLDPARCSGDGACAHVCPSGAITVQPAETGWTWQLDDSHCVFCGLCVAACPDGALAATGDFELSVRDRADLVARVRFSADAVTASDGARVGR